VPVEPFDRHQGRPYSFNVSCLPLRDGDCLLYVVEDLGKLTLVPVRELLDDLPCRVVVGRRQLAPLLIKGLMEDRLEV
jgi:hypothetical protein